MILKGSRYEKVPVYQATDADGKEVVALGIRFLAPAPAGYFHTVRAGDRLDILAYNFYRNPEKFWLIADANPAMDPDELIEPGQQLCIPPDRTT